MSTSARKENRWKKQIQESNDTSSDRKMEVEAFFMERPNRKEPVPPAPPACRRTVRAWMLRNAQDYESATAIAEGANAALDLPNGAMDDPGHWVWDEAVRALPEN